MGSIMGTPPSVSSQPSTTAGQQQLLSYISQALQGFIGQAQPGATTPPTPSVAPMTPTQQQISDQALTTEQQMMAPVNASQSALSQLLSGQPQDYSSYIGTNIVAPMEQAFTQQTLPAIKASMATSAGGAFGGGGPNTGTQGAVTQATENLNQNIGQAVSALTTQAVTNAANQQVSALGMVPALAGIPGQAATTAAGLAATPQQTQEQGILTQNQQWQTLLSALMSAFQTGTGASTASTMNTVVNPGQPGILGGLLGGIGQGAGALGMKSPLGMIPGL